MHPNPNRASHPRVRLAIAALAAVAAACLPASAQDAAPKQPFLNYGINLLPDTGGTLNVRASADLNWLPWLSSSVEIGTDNYTETFDLADDVSTLVSSGRSARLALVRIDEDVLGLLGLRLPFLRFSAGLVGAWDWIGQERYGYDPATAPSTVFYIDESAKTSLRPLQSYSLGLVLGPVSLSGRFESTIYWSPERVSASHYDSTMPSAPAAVATDYVGGDTLAGADLELDLRVVSLIGGFEYYRHVMTDFTVAGTNMSETTTYRGALLLSFIKLGSGSPLVGAGLVRKNDYFPAADANVESSAVRLELGFRY